MDVKRCRKCYHELDDSKMYWCKCGTYNRNLFSHDALFHKYKNQDENGGDDTKFDGKTNLLDQIEISGMKPDSGLVYIRPNAGDAEVYVGVIFEDTCFSKDFAETEVTVKDKKYCEQ